MVKFPIKFEYPGYIKLSDILAIFKKKSVFFPQTILDCTILF